MSFRLRHTEPTEAQVSSSFLRALSIQPWALHVQIPKAKTPKAATAAVKRAAQKARVDWYVQLVDRLKSRPACLAFWRSNTGAGQLMSGSRYVEFGLWGQPDIEGILSPVGIRVGIELKRMSTQLAPQQKAHRDLLEAAGGLHLVVRDPAQGLEDLKALLETRLDAPL